MQDQLNKLLRETNAVARRIVTELFRLRRSLVFWVIFPVIILSINGLIIAEQARGQGVTTAQAFLQSTPVSLVGVALFFSGMGGTVAALVSEREHGTLRRLYLTPLSGLSYFLGILLAESTVALIQTGVLLAVAYGLGVRLQGSGLLALWIIVLSQLSYVGSGFLLGSRMARRTEDVIALVSTIGIPLLILGGSFMPSWLFPEQLLRLAWFDPVFHMNEALLAVWTQGEGWSAVRAHVIFLQIYSLAVLLLSWVAYRRMYRHERRI